MGFFKKLKSFFSDEENEEEKESQDNEWITLDISLMVPYPNISEIREYLKPYAEEIGWKIHDFESYNKEREEWKEKNPFDEEMMKSARKVLEKEMKKEGKDFPFEDFDKPFKIENPEKTQVSINLYPEGRLTPDDFLEIKEKLFAIAYAISRDLVYGGNNEKAQKDFRETINFNYSRTEGEEPKKGDWTIKQSVGFLNIDYPLNKRLNLENEDKDKALKIFGREIEKDVKSIFAEKPQKQTKKKSSTKKSKEDEKWEKEMEEAHKNMRKELKDLFGFNI